MKPLVILCLSALPVLAQCPPGGCPAPGMPGPHYAPLPYVLPPLAEPVPDSRSVTWCPAKGEPGRIGLWYGDEYLGKLNPYTGEWFTRRGTTVDIRGWTTQHNPPAGGRAATPLPIGNPEPEKEPAPVPRAGVCECDDCPGGDQCQCGCKTKAAADLPNFGVEPDKVGNRGERFSIGGRAATPEEALKAIAAPSIPDDSALPRLTVIGPEAARQAILKDLNTHASLAQWRGKLVVKDYPADHWRITSGGFVTPTGTDAVVYVQQPDGSVLWRQDRYTGPEQLAGALRDRVPGYDPAKDPTPNSKPGPAPGPVPGPDSAPGPPLPFNPWWLAPVAVVILFLLMRRR